MNYAKSLALFFLTLVATALAQTNFYEQVSTLWFEGNKTNVLNIAEQRLSQNPNDIAGLILKMEYEIAYVQIEDMSNTMIRVLDVGENISSVNFTSVFPSVRADINNLLSLIPLYPTNQIAEDRSKGNLSHKPLIYSKAIEALQNDGYFEEE